ncbi:MAG: CHAT domain-containing protein, partial [Catenulispora sp.]|nr:CHAT domain-containing protein [Catenulispora sp.]
WSEAANPAARRIVGDRLAEAAVAADPAARRTVLDRVISSYTPTVRALAHARSQQSATAGPTLIVAVPDAPELPPLPGVVDEAEAVAALIPDSRRPEHPVRADVLRALPTHPLVHLSCHGLADWKDPAASRLMLYDYRTAPLTVADISALRLTGTLAFLSACDTASAGPRLTDEALHLTGAFHLAGYQNVIGTQWPVDERAASRVAIEFYAYLTAGGTKPPDTTDCAYALHQAIRLLRSEYPNTPTHWAAHTHTGT